MELVNWVKKKSCGLLSQNYSIINLIQPNQLIQLNQLNPTQSTNPQNISAIKQLYINPAGNMAGNFYF